MRRSTNSLIPPNRHVKFCCTCIVAVLLLCAHPSSFAQDPARAPGWVVLPIDEYQALRNRAFPAERDPDPPPVEATLSRVDYDLRVIGDLATGRASLTVDVLKDGWVRVPIPSGLLVREARLDGKLVSLVSGNPGKGGNQLSAVLSHSGRAILLLDIALPVAATAGDESISLPSTASGVTRAQVQLPRQGVDVKLSGGLLASQTEANAESTWLVYGRGNEPLTFTWHRKLDDHHVTLPLRMRGSLTQLLGLGEDSTSVYAEVDLDVIQGEAHAVKVLLPESITVNQVSGAMVADWEAKNGELAVTFLEPVEQGTRFVITGETRIAREGKIEAPLLRLLNAERETGGIAVEVLGAGEIKDAKSQGMEPADASDLGEMVGSRQSPSLVAYRFRSGDPKLARSLNLDVARYAQQAVLMANIEEARYQVLMSKEGKTLIQARYAIRNNQRNFLKIKPPPGAVVWSVSLAGRPVRPGQAPDGGLLLPLEKAKAGDDTPAFTVEVIYLSRDTVWTERGKAKLTLPTVDLPISRTGLLLYHPPLFKVAADPGAFRTETYEAPSSAAFNPAVPYGPVSGDDKDLRGRVAEKGLTQLQNMAPGIPANGSQVLVDNFRKETLGGRSARVLPISVSFPAFGPSIFLVSELTAENQPPSIELSYQHDKKEGGR
ncbi:MAG TPA: hypothetical protein VN176_00505 [Verrucomicrobiae bacterium]|jgi:hypothetical protein|nr:hypothetical protein [Verrucomicrobiae bacterium]